MLVYCFRLILQKIVNLLSFQDYLAKKGPRTCQQMFSFLGTAGCGNIEDRKAICHNYDDLFKIIQDSEELHILTSHLTTPDPVNSLICLPQQRYHFETGVNEIIDYLKANGGECWLNAAGFSKLFQLMPSETALGKGEKCFEQTLTRLCGTHFMIVGRKLVLLSK